MPRFDDLIYIKQALDIARQAWGCTHPNPMVGAIIVDHGGIVAVGHHERAGAPHAEVAALDALQEPLSENATLYVTLEPCSTHGRTPPCTDAIINSGIKRVVIGAFDPNPAHTGRAVDILKATGIEVVTGMHDGDCADLNMIFNHWIVHNTPFLAAKIATTLDGKVATRTGHSQWITGEKARRSVHNYRRLFPAIAVGPHTLLADNPRLTARQGREAHCPRRFVIDRNLLTAERPEALNVYADDFASRTTVACLEGADADREKRLEQLGINVWRLPEDANGSFWDAFGQRCAQEAICGVYFEGGTGLISNLLKEQRLHYLFAYRAPKLLADSRALPMAEGREVETLAQAITLSDVRQAKLDDDQLMRGHIVYPG